MMDVGSQEWQPQPSKKTWLQILSEFFDPPELRLQPYSTEQYQALPSYVPPPEIPPAAAASKESPASAQ
jgi:hypothetical protein